MKKPGNARLFVARHSGPTEGRTRNPEAIAVLYLDSGFARVPE